MLQPTVSASASANFLFFLLLNRKNRLNRAKPPLACPAGQQAIFGILLYGFLYLCHTAVLGILPPYVISFLGHGIFVVFFKRLTVDGTIIDDKITIITPYLYSFIILLFLKKISAIKKSSAIKINSFFIPS